MSHLFLAFHPDAEEFYNSQADLHELCNQLASLQSLKGNIKITLFTHIKPMLLERCNIEKVERLFREDEKQYFIQSKHDGERSQIHMKHGRFRYFTRNGFDITSRPAYGEFRDSGIQNVKIRAYI